MPKPTKPSAIDAAPEPPIRGVDPRTIFATKSAVWIDYQHDDLWPYMTAVVDYADLSNDYVDAQLTLVTDEAVAASDSAAEALGYRNEAEVFRDSAETAAAAAQAGAGLPTVGNDDDVLTLIDSANNTVAFKPPVKDRYADLVVSNWTIRASAADNNWQSICWSSELGLFCAVATSGTGNRVMTSPDGINWTIRASAADNAWQSICWSSELGLFCAVAYTGTGNRVMTSLYLPTSTGA